MIFTVQRYTNLTETNAITGALKLRHVCMNYRDNYQKILGLMSLPSLDFITERYQRFISLYFSGYSFFNWSMICCAFSGSIFCNIVSSFFSSLCSLSFDCGDPTYSRKDSPPTCHISCKNSDCQFSMVSLIVWLMQPLSSIGSLRSVCSSAYANHAKVQCIARLMTKKDKVTHRYPRFLVFRKLKTLDIYQGTVQYCIQIIWHVAGKKYI